MGAKMCEPINATVSSYFGSGYSVSDPEADSCTFYTLDTTVSRVWCHAGDRIREVTSAARIEWARAALVLFMHAEARGAANMQPKAPCYILTQLPNAEPRDYYNVALVGTETTADVTYPVAMLLGAYCQVNACYVNGSVPERDEGPQYRSAAFSVPQAESFYIDDMADTLAEVLRLPVYYLDDYAAPGAWACAEPSQQ